MYLRDFAEIRGIKPDTVASYIRKHPEIAEFTSMEGKFMVLSDEAVELLEKKYPLPKPVQVIQDTESLKKLTVAQEKLTELHEKYEALLTKNTELALQAGRVVMLEASEQEKADRIAKLEADIDRRDEILDQREQELAAVQQQLVAAKQELADFESLPWYKRITWKKK